MSFLSYKVLLENSLYTNPVERANLVADKQKLMDALLINFFGFIGLYAISDKRGQMQHYSSEEKKLIPSMIGDDNKDVSLVIRLALDAGLLKQTGANAMSKLLALIKQKQVKAGDIDNAKIRELVSDILYTAHPPTTYVKQAFNDFVEGRSDVAHLAKSFFEIVRAKKDYHPITVEFRAIALTYRPYFDQLPDVVALTPGAIPHSHAANSLANRIKKGQTRAPTSAVTVPGVSPTPATPVVVTQPKTKKVKAVPVPAVTVTPGYTIEFFNEALNARSQKEINVLLKKYQVEAPTKDAGRINNFSQKIVEWTTHIATALRTNLPLPDLKISDCDEGVGKYIKKIGVSYYSRYLALTWEIYSKNHTIQESAELITHMFDSKTSGQNVVDRAGSLLVTTKEKLLKEIETLLTTATSVEDTLKKMWPLDKMVSKGFTLPHGKLQSMPVFSQYTIADAICTQLSAITFDRYNPLHRFFTSTSDFIARPNSFGKTFIIPENNFNKLLPVQKNVLLMLGDRLKVETNADIKNKITTLMNPAIHDRTAVSDLLRYVRDALTKNAITNDEYEACVVRAFEINFDEAVYAARYVITITHAAEIISKNKAKFVEIISKLESFEGIDGFFKIDSATHDLIPLIINRHTQKDFLKLYLDKGYSGGVFTKIAEWLGSKYEPNNMLLTDAFNIFGRFSYLLWEAAEDSQVLADATIMQALDDKNSITPVIDVASKIKKLTYNADGDQIVKMWIDLIKTNSNLETFIKNKLENEITPEELSKWIETDHHFSGIGLLARCLGYIPDTTKKKIEDEWEKKLVLNRSFAFFPKNNQSPLVPIAETVFRKVFNSNAVQIDRMTKITMSKNIPVLAKEEIGKLTPAEIEAALKDDVRRGVDDHYSRERSGFFTFVDTIKGLNGTEGCPANLGKLANAAFKFAKENKKTFKKQYRDEFAEHVLGLMMSDIESKDAAQAFADIDDNLLKKRFLTEFVTVELATKASEELNNRNLPIAPVNPLTKSQVSTVLKLNGVEIPFDRSLIKSTDIKKVKEQVETHTKKMGFQKLAVEEVKASDKELIAESLRLDQYNRHAHGETAFLVKKMFKVAIPRQTAGFPEWKKAHPNATEMLQFHGTSSLPAAMIMRYGFTVVDQASAHSAGIKYAGKMLGDGIYCSNVIDKVGQYLGESGMTRRYGTMGYLFEMTAQMEKWGSKVAKNSANDYASAGTGRGGETYNTVSPEWAMRDPEQFNIFRCYHVEIISKSKMKELREENLKESFSFKDFLKEAREEQVNMKKISYCFVDGTIPVEEFDAKEFDEIAWDQYPNAKLDFNRQGVVVQFDCPANQDEFHETVIWTRAFMQDKNKLTQFLALLKSKN